MPTSGALTGFSFDAHAFPVGPFPCFLLEGGDPGLLEFSKLGEGEQT